MLGKKSLSFLLLIIVFMKLFLLNIYSDGIPATVIKVGLFQRNGYFEKSEQGYSGYGVEYFDVLSNYINLETKYVEGELEDLIKKLNNGEIDLISGINRGSAEYFDTEDLLFSDFNVGISYTYLTTRADNDKLLSNNYKTLDGITIGFLEGYNNNRYFKEFAAVNGFSYKEVKYFNSDQLHNALNNGSVNAIIEPGSKIPQNAKILASFNLEPLYIAVSNKNPQLFSYINYAIDKLEKNHPYLHDELNEKYYKAKININNLAVTNGDFTKEELDYIRTAGIIRFSYTGTRVVKGDANVSFNGYVYEYILKLAEKTGLRIEMTEVNNNDESFALLKNGELDVIANYPSNNIKSYENSNIQITNSYLSKYYNFIINKEYIPADNYIVAVYKGGSANEKLLGSLPNSIIKTYENYSECIEAVNNNSADITFLSDHITEMLYNQDIYSNVCIRGVPNFVENLTFAVSSYRDPILINILNKGINKIDSREIEAMIAKDRFLFSQQGNAGLLSIFSNYIFIVIIVSILLLTIIIFLIFNNYQKRKFKEKTLKMSNTDPLTGERNLQYFIDDAQKILKVNSACEFSVIQINIRNFKYINDVYGNSGGDELLLYLSRTIAVHLEKDELQTRANSDNFIVLLRKIEASSILKFFNTLRLDMHKRVGNDANDMLGDIYCGIYQGGTGKDLPVVEMIECANIAIRKASQEKSSYIFYDEKMRLEIMRESSIIKSMYDALKNKEFKFFLQPQHNIKQDDKVNSAEALVRWFKPDGTVVPPNDFISIFERNGFIVELDRYIFEEVCKFIHENLNEEWFEGIKIAVNVSRLDLYKNDFVQFYSQRKNFYNIPDGRIELEFTESVVFENYETFKYVLKALKENGFTCSLDDFGAGSSSLNVLKELPVDILKMDRLFFTEAEDTARNNSVIASIIAMARGLNMVIVAEGIEELEQINFLKRIGCDIIQGFIYSKPLPVEEFKEYVNKFKNFNSFVKKNEIEFYHKEEDNEVIKKKYIATLNFVNAMVNEIYLDNDVYNIVSFGNDTFYYPVVNGSYSLELENYVNKYVFEEDRDKYRANCSIQNIIACFYRGDNMIECEYRAKTYDKELERFSDDYEWHSVTTLRINISDKTHMLAMQYTQNIQDKYDAETNLILSQNRLGMAIKGIRGTVYEINIQKNKLNVIQRTSVKNQYTLTNGNAFEQLIVFAEKYIHKDDKERFLHITQKQFIDDFFASNKEQYFIEFREMTSDSKYVWKSANFMKNFDEPYLVLAIIQDITDKKLIEEQLISTERRMSGIVDHLYSIVLEINLKENTFITIKSNDARFLSYQDLSFTQMRDIACKTFPIHSDYADKLREMLFRENIISEFSKGADELSFEYLVMIDNKYIWYSLTVCKEQNSNTMAIVYIKNIDKQKREQDRLKRRANYDMLTQVYNKETVYELADSFLSTIGKNNSHLLLVIDIDKFVDVNNEHGHQYGDYIINDVVKQLKNHIKVDDYIGRVGGDEFFVFIKNINSEDDVQLKLQELSDIFKKDINEKIISDKNEERLPITACIGAAVFPLHGDNFKKVFNCMDIALSAAKNKGCGSVVLYNLALSDKDLLQKRYYSSIGSQIDINSIKETNDEVMKHIYQVISKASNIKDAMNVVLNFIGNQFNVSRAYIMEYSENKMADMIEWTDKNIESVSGSIDKIQPEKAFIPYMVHKNLFKNDDFFVCNDVNSLTQDAQVFFMKYGVKAVMQAAIICDGEFKGIVGFDDCNNIRVWNDRENEILVNISRIMGINFLSTNATDDALHFKDVLSEVEYELFDNEEIIKKG